jgi:tetratricopeptide (TPR) repeat protein
MTDYGQGHNPMSDRRKHLEFLRRTAKDAIWSGDYERALTLYEDGLALARSWKDRELEDLFTCNRATTLLEMDRQDFDLSRLKEIVLRSPGSPNAVLAGYASAHAHEVRGEYAKAAFYAQGALQKSRDLRLDDWTAASLNLLANLELHESRFEQARGLFQEALDRFESDGKTESSEAAVVADNLGYCHIALDAVPVGLPLVERSLALLESLGSRQAMDYPCLDLCFASLKLERIDAAESWGVRALGFGREFGRNDVVKNAHYLLAETYSEMGRESAADEHYEALASYYPDFPALKNYLHQISLMGMINLRA